MNGIFAIPLIKLPLWTSQRPDLGHFWGRFGRFSGTYAQNSKSKTFSTYKNLSNAPGFAKKYLISEDLSKNRTLGSNCQKNRLKGPNMVHFGGFSQMSPRYNFCVDEWIFPKLCSFFEEKSGVSNAREKKCFWPFLTKLSQFRTYMGRFVLY